LSLRAAALGYLALLLVLPLGMVFWRTFQHGLGPVWGAATAPDALHALWLTVLIALIAVPANTVFGVVCALVIVRGRFQGKTFLNALVDLPFALGRALVRQEGTNLFGRRQTADRIDINPAQELGIARLR